MPCKALHTVHCHYFFFLLLHFILLSSLCLSDVFILACFFSSSLLSHGSVLFCCLFISFLVACVRVWYFWYYWCRCFCYFRILMSSTLFFFPTFFILFRFTTAHQCTSMFDVIATFRISVSSRNFHFSIGVFPLPPKYSTASIITHRFYVCFFFSQLVWHHLPNITFKFNEFI